VVSALKRFDDHCAKNWEKQLTSNTATSKKKVTSNRCYPNSQIETDPKRTPHGVGWGVHNGYAHRKIEKLKIAFFVVFLLVLLSNNIFSASSKEKLLIS